MKRSKLIVIAVALMLVIASCACLAIFASGAADTAKLTVNTGDGKIQVYVGGVLKNEGTSSVSLNVPVGETVKLAVPESETNFLFWTDSALNQCLVNKQAVREYSFTMNSAATYTAWFAPEGESLVIYQNTNDTKQVLATATYSKTAEFTAHLADNALLYGNTFAGWNKTTDVIQAAIANGESVIYVEPNYTKINRTHKVTVAGGTINGSATSGEYAYLEKITLTPNTVAGESFVGWKDSAGNFISNASTLNVWVIADETFTAVFSGTAVTQEPYVHLDVFSTGEKLAESYAKHFVPSGMTLNEYGIVFVKNADYPEEDLVLQNVDGVAVKKSSLPGSTSTGILLDYFVGVETLSVRAYIIYTDASGNEKTLYSDAHYVGGAEEAKIEELLDLKHTLRVDENGDFKVVMFSDLQCNTADPNGTSAASVAFKESLENIKTIVDREQPDLVLFGGDNCFDIKTEDDFRAYVGHMVSYIEEKKIPWAHVFGNHDDESEVWPGESISKIKQHEIYTEFEYCISKDVEELFGVGNYVLPVLTNDGSKIAFNVWALDSGQYDHVFDSSKDNIVFDGNGFYGHYQSMEKNQVDWYVETSELLEKYNGGEKIPAMLYMHIPLQESYFAYKYGTNLVGVKGENISAHPENVGLFSAILDRGDIKLIAHGHDHKNDFSVEYKGVTFAYTACIGVQEYHDETMVGGRVINFSTKEPDKVETHMSYVIERAPLDYDSPILEMVIGDDDTVKNNVEGRPTLESYVAESRKNVIMSENAIDGKFIRFNGTWTGNESSSYYMTFPISQQPIISDGFAIETMFRIAEKNTSTAIIDYCESGGFGISFNGEGKLSIDVGKVTDSTYANITTDVELNQWYHLVVDFNTDGDTPTLTVYLNGEVLGTATVDGGYRGPDFGTTTPYISVGSRADAGFTNRGGFRGDIAIANVFAKPVSANEAKAMYEAAKPVEPEEPEEVDSYILKLDIADDGTVSNAAKNRPTLQSYTGTSGTKTITSDNSINRKFINFVGGADSNASSTYWMPMTTIPDSELADGFTVEAMFRAPAKPSSSYINIIDYCEAGGFGVYYSSDGKLHFDMGHASSYALSSTPINPGEWYHVVATYDSTNLKILIYVNGVKATEVNVDTGYRGPSLRGTSSDYVCIGAGAQKDTYGDKGFTGDIAIANIHKDTATADQAKAMYDAVMTKILCLNIDATNQTVTNGVETGPVLNEVTHANSSKTITTDSEIGRDIVTFTPRGQWATTDAYTIKTTNVNSDLANGFSFEMYFKIDNVNNLASHYLGILNYEEGGGFGFNLVPCSDSTMTTLSLEFVTDDGNSASYSKDVKLGEWVHCVFVYDGPTADTISFYVNGELLGGAKKTLTGDFKLPSSFSTEPFIAIGACADSANTTINGIAGSIAICNIYSNPLTAGQAKVAYNAAIA